RTRLLEAPDSCSCPDKGRHREIRNAADCKTHGETHHRIRRTNIEAVEQWDDMGIALDNTFCASLGA
ncbi:MAG TPA: hypothetical protein VGO08_18315, partial [Burkholderiales bacterium]|nr:hypothetical protein [Burkholderiales bacterium]